MPNRATLSQQDLQWWTSLITFTLTEIDRLRKAGRPILLLAATNHFEHLDAALVRLGRLERRVSVLPPNEQERLALFASCLGSRIGREGLSSLARLSVLATSARIESWCRSAIAAAEAAGRPLALRDLIELIAPRGQRSDRTDRAVASHEAGHAIVAHDLGVPVTEISILLDALFTWLTELAPQAGWQPVQIKEKFATLRFYWTGDLPTLPSRRSRAPSMSPATFARFVAHPARFRTKADGWRRVAGPMRDDGALR